MQKTTFIYALCEPGTRTVRYIGKSCDLKRRFREHLKRSIKTDTYLGNWLRLLASKGESPSLEVFREVEGDGSEAEMRYIRLARGCGMRLVNSSDGGDGVTMTPEVRRKMSLSRTGEKNPNFGKTPTDETRAKMSASHLGVPLSPTHCASLKARFSVFPHPNLGKTASDETRALQSAAKKGRPATEIQKKCLSFGQQSGINSPHFGIKHSPERCAANGLRNKGTRRSEEVKAKMKAAQQLRRAKELERDQDIEWALAPYTLE